MSLPLQSFSLSRFFLHLITFRGSTCQLLGSLQLLLHVTQPSSQLVFFSVLSHSLCPTQYTLSPQMEDSKRPADCWDGSATAPAADGPSSPPPDRTRRPTTRGWGPAPKSLLEMLSCANCSMIVSVRCDELHPRGETVRIKAHRHLRHRQFENVEDNGRVCRQGSHHGATVSRRDDWVARRDHNSRANMFRNLISGSPGAIEESALGSRTHHASVDTCEDQGGEGGCMPTVLLTLLAFARSGC